MKLISTFVFSIGFNIIFSQVSVKLDSLFANLYAEHKFNGNVLIAEKGNIIYKKSFGLANEATKTLLNDNSIFELASVSKQFTAMGIVLLNEKGKLKYDDLISTYLPELSYYKGVTIRHLLNHTSGLPDYMQLLDSLLIDDTWDNKTKIATNKDIIQVFGKHQPPLAFQPNEKWSYSNTGYALLASIIEKVSGKTYADFLNSEIFLPLKMVNTFVYTRRYKPQVVKNYAFGYVYSDSLKRNALPDEVKGLDLYVYTLDGIVGDGTVNSTTNDLLLWDRALYSNQLISEKAKQAIFTSSKLNDGKETRYGFGWSLEQHDVFGNISSHSGSWPGYITYIERHETHDKTILILQNNDNDNIKNPIKSIRALLYGIKPLTINPDYLKKLSGNYKTEKGKLKKIIFENGKLYIPMNEEVKLELEPISKTVYKVIGFNPEVKYEFIIENDVVKKYIVTQIEQGVKGEALKID